MDAWNNNLVDNSCRNSFCRNFQWLGNLGLKPELWLGNLDAERDWGHAKDYIEAMWLMLQQNEPEDFVIATGITTSVRQFLIKAFSFAGVEIQFQGQGLNEKAIVSAIFKEGLSVRHGDVVVEIDARYFRPAEVDQLLGDASKAKEKLGWHRQLGGWLRSSHPLKKA